MSRVDVKQENSRVRQRLTSQIYIRIDDETYDKILEIQEKIPKFRYSSYLRPIIIEEIDRLHRATMNNPKLIRKLIELLNRKEVRYGG